MTRRILVALALVALCGCEKEDVRGSAPDIDPGAFEAMRAKPELEQAYQDGYNDGIEHVVEILKDEQLKWKNVRDIGEMRRYGK